MSGIGQCVESVGLRESVALVERADAPVPWALATHAGPARACNEDRWRVDDAHGTFVLADGMGGHDFGEVASEIAVRTVAETVGTLRDAGLPASEAFDRAVAASHAGIVEFAHSRTGCLGIGTTLVAASIGGGWLTVAHVGDSRAYLLRDGVLRRLTRDHSIGQQMLDAGRLTEAQVRRLPARGILTRALGADAAAPQAELGVHEWHAGDLVLLCSDGLTDWLDDAAVRALLNDPRRSLGERASDLIVAAHEHGCTDDATVLLAGSSRRPAAAR